MATVTSWMKGLFTSPAQNTIAESIDFATRSSLQNILLNEGTEQRVEVNQRALVDKLLARYKGEFTVFRELIQNSDDAVVGENNNV